MANKCMRKCLTSLTIREVQVKTIIRYHLISIRMAILKIITSIGEDIEKLESVYVVGGNVKWCSYYGKQYGSSSKT